MKTLYFSPLLDRSPGVDGVEKGHGETEAKPEFDCHHSGRRGDILN